MAAILFFRLLNDRAHSHSYSTVPTIQNPDYSKTDLQNVQILNVRFSDPHCICICITEEKKKRQVVEGVTLHYFRIVKIVEPLKIWPH